MMLGLLKLSSLATIASFPAVLHRKSAATAPLLSQTMAHGCQPTSLMPDQARTRSAVVISLGFLLPRAVRISRFSDGLLWIGPDETRIGPGSPADAVLQFIDLVREAIGNGFFPAEIRFSGLRQYYGQIAHEFGWPEISDKRLSMLLVAHGCERRTRRECKKGCGDKRYRVFRFPAIPEAVSAA